MGQLHDRIAALSRRIDERINLKQAHRRLQLVAKVLIVTTFFEDALRAVFTFQIQKDSMRLAGWRNSWLHVLLPIFSFMVQTMGAALVALPTTRRLHVLNEAGCYVLMCWCAFHPFMYGQQTNWEFVLQTLTIMGGLAILLSHTMLMGLGRHAAMLLPAKAVSPAVAAAGASGGVAERAHAIQAAGRVLIVAIFLHYATGHCKGFTRRALREMQAHDWVHPVAEGLLIVGLLGMCALVIIGIKSRWVALLLAVLMSFYSCWRHPFWSTRARCVRTAARRHTDCKRTADGHWPTVACVRTTHVLTPC